MSDIPERFHLPAGDLFSPSALCGATASDEPDGILRLHSDFMENTCTACREAAGR
jgi:hypothetical protein